MNLNDFKSELEGYLGKLSGLMPVGHPWWGFDPKSKPAGVQLFSGQELSREAYPKHWELINSGKRTLVTEEEWQEMVANQGFCQFYSSGDGSTTYRMPLVRGVHPKFVAALAEAGQHIEAGLPNITGTTRVDPNTGSSYLTGAFYSTNSSGAYVFGGTSGTHDLKFDASRSSSVYRDDIDTVQPEALTLLVGEYVISSVATVGEADAESLLAGQTLLDSKVEALENGVGHASAYIVETWSSGTEWYRKYSDGWIEQGGCVSGHSVIVTFNTPFANTNYYCGAMPGSLLHGDYINIATSSRSKTSIVVEFAAEHTLPTSVYWYACGY